MVGEVFPAFVRVHVPHHAVEEPILGPAMKALQSESKGAAAAIER